MCERSPPVQRESNAVSRFMEATESSRRISRHEPLSGRRVCAHEVRGRPETEDCGGLEDAVGGRVASLARRQIGGAVAHASDNAVGQKAG